MPEEMNIGAIADAVGEELFPSTTPIEESREGAGENQESEASGFDTQPNPTAATPAPALTLPDIPLPKAWKKEKETVWQKLDREAKEYIQTREQDVLRGIEMYSSGHKNWNELIAPFAPVIQQHPNANPVQVMQTLMRNHLALVQSDENQRVQLALNLLKGYGIDPARLGLQPQQNQEQNLPPEVQRALAEVGQMRQTFSQFQEQQRQAQLSTLERQVEAFAADPKNKFFNEVADDIQRLLAKGAAEDLPSAYELACYVNPTVRAKIIAEQSTPVAPVTKPPLNVSSSLEGTPRRKKDETIDDTINSVVRRAYGTH